MAAGDVRGARLCVSCGREGWYAALCESLLIIVSSRCALRKHILSGVYGSVHFFKVRSVSFAPVRFGMF
jgi:hypothetical protein